MVFLKVLSLVGVQGWKQLSENVDVLILDGARSIEREGNFLRVEFSIESKQKAGVVSQPSAAPEIITVPEEAVVRVAPVEQVKPVVEKKVEEHVAASSVATPAVPTVSAAASAPVKIIEEKPKAEEKLEPAVSVEGESTKQEKATSIFDKKFDEDDDHDEKSETVVAKKETSSPTAEKPVKKSAEKPAETPVKQKTVAKEESSVAKDPPVVEEKKPAVEAEPVVEQESPAPIGEKPVEVQQPAEQVEEQPVVEKPLEHVEEQSAEPKKATALVAEKQKVTVEEREDSKQQVLQKKLVELDTLDSTVSEDDMALIHGDADDDKLLQETGLITPSVEEKPEEVKPVLPKPDPLAFLDDAIDHMRGKKKEAAPVTEKDEVLTGLQGAEKMDAAELNFKKETISASAKLAQIKAEEEEKKQQEQQERAKKAAAVEDDDEDVQFLQSMVKGNTKPTSFLQMNIKAQRRGWFSSLADVLNLEGTSGESNKVKGGLFPVASTELQEENVSRGAPISLSSTSQDVSFGSGKSVFEAVEEKEVTFSQKSADLMMRMVADRLVHDYSSLDTERDVYESKTNASKTDPNKISLPKHTTGIIAKKQPNGQVFLFAVKSGIMDGAVDIDADWSHLPEVVTEAVLSAEDRLIKKSHVVTGLIEDDGARAKQENIQNNKNVKGTTVTKAASKQVPSISMKITPTPAREPQVPATVPVTVASVAARTPEGKVQAPAKEATLTDSKEVGSKLDAILDEYNQRGQKAVENAENAKSNPMRVSDETKSETRDGSTTPSVDSGSTIQDSRKMNEKVKAVGDQLDDLIGSYMDRNKAPEPTAAPLKTMLTAGSKNMATALMETSQNEKVAETTSAKASQKTSETQQEQQQQGQEGDKWGDLSSHFHKVLSADMAKSMIIDSDLKNAKPVAKTSAPAQPKEQRKVSPLDKFLGQPSAIVAPTLSAAVPVTTSVSSTESSTDASSADATSVDSTLTETTKTEAERALKVVQAKEAAKDAQYTAEYEAAHQKEIVEAKKEMAQRDAEKMQKDQKLMRQVGEQLSEIGIPLPGKGIIPAVVPDAEEEKPRTTVADNFAEFKKNLAYVSKQHTAVEHATHGRDQKDDVVAKRDTSKIDDLFARASGNPAPAPAVEEKPAEPQEQQEATPKAPEVVKTAEVKTETKAEAVNVVVANKAPVDAEKKPETPAQELVRKLKADEKKQEVGKPEVAQAVNLNLANSTTSTAEASNSSDVSNSTIDEVNDEVDALMHPVETMLKNEAQGNSTANATGHQAILLSSSKGTVSRHHDGSKGMGLVSTADSKLKVITAEMKMKNREDNTPDDAYTAKIETLANQRSPMKQWQDDAKKAEASKKAKKQAEKKEEKLDASAALRAAEKDIDSLDIPVRAAKTSSLVVQKSSVQKTISSPSVAASSASAAGAAAAAPTPAPHKMSEIEKAMREFEGDDVKPVARKPTGHNVFTPWLNSKMPVPPVDTAVPVPAVETVDPAVVQMASAGASEIRAASPVKTVAPQGNPGETALQAKLAADAQGLLGPPPVKRGEVPNKLKNFLNGPNRMETPAPASTMLVQQKKRTLTGTEFDNMDLTAVFSNTSEEYQALLKEDDGKKKGDNTVNARNQMHNLMAEMSDLAVGGPKTLDPFVAKSATTSADPKTSTEKTTAASPAPVVDSDAVSDDDVSVETASSSASMKASATSLDDQLLASIDFGEEGGKGKNPVSAVAETPAAAKKEARKDSQNALLQNNWGSWASKLDKVNI